MGFVYLKLCCWPLRRMSIEIISFIQVEGVVSWSGLGSWSGLTLVRKSTFWLSQFLVDWPPNFGERCLFSCCSLLLLLHLHMENPEKKQTEHWMVIAPSDFRSNVADWCKIISSDDATSHNLSHSSCHITLRRLIMSLLIDVVVNFVVDNWIIRRNVCKENRLAASFALHFGELESYNNTRERRKSKFGERQERGWVGEVDSKGKDWRRCVCGCCTAAHKATGESKRNKSNKEREGEKATLLTWVENVKFTQENRARLQKKKKMWTEMKMREESCWKLTKSEFL